MTTRLLLLMLAGGCAVARGQAPGPDGIALERDSAGSSFTLSWNADTYWRYFYIIYSEDMSVWDYFPVVEQWEGSGPGVMQYGISSTAPKLFLRVVKMTEDPFTLDVDGDGMIDGWEVVNGLKLNLDDSGLDKDGDGLSNLYEFSNGLNPNVDDSGLDKDGDGRSNLDEFIANTAADDPAPVLTLSGPAGATLN